MNEAEDLLRAAVSPAYWAACTAHLAAAGGGTASQPTQRARLALQQLLQADLNKCGAPRLPQGVQGLHNTTLRGKFLLQADEVLNIGAAVRERYSGHDGNGRCLKLLLSDGVQQVAALEYRPIPALRSTTPAGTKLLLWDVPVRRGMLLLTQQNCSVLGGSVPALEAARQRMLAHWAQPAVGRRGPPPSIQQATAEATKAAWANTPVGGGGPPRPPQHQLVQPPAPQQQQARGPGPSQQSTQLLSQQQQRQQLAGGPRAGGVQPRPQASMQPQQQQQQQQIGSGRSPTLHGPLQELNGAPSGGASMRSRLALPKHAPAAGAQPPPQQQVQLLQPPDAPPAAAPAPADFSFVQPPQRQPGAPPHAPQRMQAHVQPQLLRRLRESAAAGAAGGGLAAGTDDDPICLDSDDRRPGCGQQAAQPRGDVMAVGQAAGAGAEADADLPPAADGDVEMADGEQLADGGGWQGGDEGWDDQPAGGHVDPWEQGYDETLQLADGGAGWQDDTGGGWADGGGGDGGLAAGEGEPMLGAGEPMELQRQHGEAGPGVAATGTAAAAATAEGGSDDGWDDDEEAEQQQQQQRGPAGDAAGLPTVQASPPAATQQHGLGRSISGAARQLLRQQGESSEGSSQPRPSGHQLADRKQPHQCPAARGAAADDAASAKSTTMGLQVLVAAPRTVTKPAAAGPAPQQGSGPAGPGLPGVPELEPLDPELLEAAPTLAEVLLARPAEEPAPPARRRPAAAAAAAAGPAAVGGAALPAMAAFEHVGPQGQAAAVIAPEATATGDSDEDMPSFGLLGDLSPPKQQPAVPAISMDEPFCYLLHLAAKANAAGSADFPLCARILASVKTFVGKLQFRDPQTGAPQYGMEMLVEDGSLVVRASLDHAFIARLFEMEPPEFEACLADPARRGHAAELAKGLQQLMASYSGLMEVQLPSPGQRLEVTNLLGDMTGGQAEAFQRRATGAAG